MTTPLTPSATAAAPEGDVEALRKSVEMALMYLETGFVTCDRCGHQVETKDMDAAYELRSALAASRPPAASGAVEPARRLYLDLDGVMADFDAHFPATFGLDHRGMADDEMWKSINAHPSYFRDMPPCAGAIEFFRSIEHLRPIILTACPRTNYQHVARQKRAWVREHLSEHVTVLPVMGGRNKPLFMQEAGDVLIDDWSKNTEAWEEAGGVAILHSNFKSTGGAVSRLFPAGPAAPSAEPDAGVRHAEERAAICRELGCIDKPGVPLSFVQDLRRRYAEANRRNGDLIRSWDPATPTERQELDRMRRGWGPSSPTERERRRLDVASCLSALSIAMSDLSVGEDEDVPEEARDRLDEAYDRVSQQYAKVAETLHALVADPQEWPDIKAAEERGAAQALAAIPTPSPNPEDEDWKEDPSADERWNAGLDYGMTQICVVLGVDPAEVNWDAATETLDGDVRSVTRGILAKWAGDEWQSLPKCRPEPDPRPEEVEGLREARQKLPRLTEDMMRAACEAHFGSDNIYGVDVSVGPSNYSFHVAFKRMWSGIRKHLTASPGDQPAGDA